MESQPSLPLLLCAFLLASPSLAYTNFYVGGKDGWVLSPSESYNHWAGRNRFQVNDTLVFKYKQGSDSVLLVNKEDYYSCSRKNALRTMTSGSSVFQFPHSGPFYFISGKEGSCEMGQKLIVVVLAVRPKPSPKTPPPVSSHPTTSPSPVAQTPTQPPPLAPVSPPSIAEPPTWVPHPSGSPASPPHSYPHPYPKPPTWSPVPSQSPSPASQHTPSGYPVYPPQAGPSPYAKPPSWSNVPSQSPKSLSPALHPSPSGSPVSPAPTPAGKTPTSSPAKPPGTAESPKSSLPPVVSPTAAKSPTPPGTTPESGQGPASSPNGGESDLNAPGPSAAAAWAITPSSMLLAVMVSIAMGVCA